MFKDLFVYYTSSNSSVIFLMISAFCMFLNISILTVPVM